MTVFRWFRCLSRVSQSYPHFYSNFGFQSFSSFRNPLLLDPDNLKRESTSKNDNHMNIPRSVEVKSSYELNQLLHFPLVDSLNDLGCFKNVLRRYCIEVYESLFLFYSSSFRSKEPKMITKEQKQRFINFHAIAPQHILEAAQVIQTINEEQLQQLVQLITRLHLYSDSSKIELDDLYQAVVEDSILRTIVTVGNFRNIISMYALLNMDKDMGDINKASRLIANWMDELETSTVIYQVLDLIKNRLSKTLRTMDLTQKDMRHFESLHNKLSTIYRLLSTGLKSATVSHSYTTVNLTQIKILRHRLRDLNEQFFKQAAEYTRPFSSEDRRKLLELMSEIMDAQSSYAKSKGYSSYAEMNLDLSSTMAARVGGTQTIHQLHAYIIKALNQKSLNLSLLMNTIDHEISYRCNLQTVLMVLFDLCMRLFDLRFEIEDEEKLNDLFSQTKSIVVHVYDGCSSFYTESYLGSIILDPFQRYGKAQGEFLVPILNQKVNALTFNNQSRLTFISLNIPRSSSFLLSSKGMTLRDAQALFHEFGHALEVILRSTKGSGGIDDVYEFSVGSTTIEQDCSEMVSQFMEYWLYHKMVLTKVIATEGDLSKACERVLEGRKRKKLVELFHRIRLSELELNLHGPRKASKTRSNKLIDGTSVEAMLSKSKNLFAPILHLSNSSFVSEEDDIEYLINIFVNNARGKNTLQYRYLWSEIMSADAFGAFTHTDLISDEERRNQKTQEMGLAFRRCFLERRDKMESSFRVFRGRDAIPEIYLKYIFER